MAILMKEMRPLLRSGWPRGPATESAGGRCSPTCKSLLGQIAKVLGETIKQLVLAFGVVGHFN